MPQSSPSHPDHPAIREGIVAGLIGASVVALFFLGIDLIRGLPLLTPSVLGEVFVLREPSAVTTSVNTTAVLLYTAAHLLVFCAIGLALAQGARHAEESSLVRIGLVMGFIAFELFFYGALQVVDETTRGLFPQWSVLMANALAALVMGLYLWRHHPRISTALGRAPLGAPETAGE